MLSNEALYFLLDEMYDKANDPEPDIRVEVYQKCIDFLTKHETQLKKDAEATEIFNIKMELFKERLEKKYNIISDIIPDYPNALVLEKKQSLQGVKEYREGWFEVQDANSQKIAPWLHPESGKYYIDACAGAGGKSLHLADLTKDSAKIVALDIYPSKLDELRKRCFRNKIQSVQTINVDDEKVLNTVKANADGVLIDAPCSGLGVLKRNPDTKWSMTPDRLADITNTQEKLLQTYAPKVKKGGNLVYATCSILPLENQIQVDNFLDSKVGSKFQLEKKHTYFSHLTGFDGFYCARLIKKCE